MHLSRKDLLQLVAVIAAAVTFNALIQTHAPLGQDVSNNALALAVRSDQSSPTDGHSPANLTLIVFTDYRCPACRGAYPAMKRAIAEDGMVRVIYKDWPIFGDVSERAAEVAIASNFQAIYPLVHDRLMTGRTDTDAALEAAVEHSGGNWGKLQSDLATHKRQILGEIRNNRLQAFGLGLGGTPGYLIGPILVRGALTELEFTRVFKQARKGA